MILTEKENGLGTISLNRPEKRNALNPELVTQLKNAFNVFFSDPEVKVIKLKGEGDAFCAGADLGVIKKLKTATYEENLADSRHLAELFEIIYHGSKPVVAAVHGHAIAGGCGLASICDFVVAAEPAKFGYTETRIGFVPAIVARFLVKKVGETHARNLLLRGHLITAGEAARIGLVTETVPAEEFEEKVNSITSDLIIKCSGQALAATKQLINKAGDLTFSEAIDAAVEVNAKARGTEDCQRGISAFLNKEKISWF
ncbi:MAG: enoyl-CoA hydratase/isomerase family protein [Balneolales bacterium]|nr:enoyl-CoA hydratase/isomerase family protein [Balneolales bacterium]